MATKNRVFQRPLPDANVPRNAFDMSKRISLNMPFGALIPVYAHQYIAGSHVKINQRAFFRTAAVNTAAFPQLKINFDWFCVPLRYLWSYWDNFKLGINDFNSSNVPVNDNYVPTPISTIPRFYCTNMHRLAYTMHTSDDGLWRDGAGYPWGLGASRLLDMLGYGRIDPTIDVGDSSLNAGQAFNPFKVLAYQKIYFDHYRNTAYESNMPIAYNIDNLTFTEEDVISDSHLYNMFRLRYVNYRKDYFQHIFPSLNYVESYPISPLSSIPSWISAAQTNYNGGATIVQSNASSFFNGVPRVQMVPTSGSNNTGFSVQSIRAMFALDKLTRSSAYAPKHVKQQYEARYGIKFPSSSSFESDRIGSFDTDITIGEVTSMANTDTGSSGDALGAIGGKGVGASDYQNTLSYDVKEDSIIMCVAYAIPRQTYDSFRFENWNMKLVQNDFFIPEFMNMGLKPLYFKEFFGTNGVETGRDNVLGYQTPYMEYKSDVDENHGLFAERDSDLGQFVVHSNSPYRRSTAVSSSGANADFFKVKPSDVDSIFVNAYDGTESTDQLFGQIDFSIPVNQNMSVHGQPSL